MALVTNEEVECRRLVKTLRKKELIPIIIEESQSAGMKAKLKKSGKIVSSLKLSSTLMHKNTGELADLIVKNNPLIEPTMVGLVMMGYILEVIYFPPNKELSYLKCNSGDIWVADDYFS